MHIRAVARPERKSWSELGVIIPVIKNRIITPIIDKTVGQSSRFIGNLVSNKNYYDCWYKIIAHICPSSLQS